MGAKPYVLDYTHHQLSNSTNTEGGRSGSMFAGGARPITFLHQRVENAQLDGRIKPKNSGATVRRVAYQMSKAVRRAPPAKIF